MLIYTCFAFITYWLTFARCCSGSSTSLSDGASQNSSLAHSEGSNVDDNRAATEHLRFIGFPRRWRLSGSQIGKEHPAVPNNINKPQQRQRSEANPIGFQLVKKSGKRLWVDCFFSPVQCLRITRGRKIVIVPRDLFAG